MWRRFLAGLVVVALVATAMVGFSGWGAPAHMALATALPTLPTALPRVRRATRYDDRHPASGGHRPDKSGGDGFPAQDAVPTIRPCEMTGRAPSRRVSTGRNARTAGHRLGRATVTLGLLVEHRPRCIIALTRLDDDGDFAPARVVGSGRVRDCHFPSHRPTWRSLARTRPGRCRPDPTRR